MVQQSIVRTLKVFIITGLCLILLGHYLLVSDLFDAANNINKIIISAACIAIGILFSLPTKIYLTILLMNLEVAHNKPAETASYAKNK